MNKGVKRVLIFSLAYYPDLVGGAEIAVKEITDRIDQSDFEFHMITLATQKDQAREEKVGNVTLHRVGFATNTGVTFALNKYLFPFTASSRASSLHRSKPFHFTWSIMASFSGFAALFFKTFHMNVPFLLTLQEGDPIEYIQNEAFKLKFGRVQIPVKFLAYPLFKMIFRRADRIQAISKYLADFGKSMEALCETTIVPNGVDTEHFSKDVSDVELETIKNRIGKKPKDIFLVTTSRLVVKNAVGDCVEALLHLPHHVKFLIIGKGELESVLKKKVRELGLESRTLFLGYIDHKELPKYLKACDVFVRPSLSEGFGNSFIEAMAAKVPVIATPIGGIVDFLKDKETGLFCEVSKPKDIARKVEIYLHDTALREEIVDNAYRMVSEKYDWNKVAQMMKEEVFEKMGTQS